MTPLRRLLLAGALTAPALTLAPATVDAHRTQVGHHQVTDANRERYVNLRHAAKTAGLRVGGKLKPRRSARMHTIHIRRLRARLDAHRAAKRTGSGGWAIPAHIVMCESGGDYNAVNPTSGAYGAYQIMPATARAFGCDLSTNRGQDICAKRIWNGQGRSAWVC